MNIFRWFKRRKQTEDLIEEPPTQVPRYDPDLVRAKQFEKQLRHRLLELDKQVNRENIWRPDR